MARQLFLSPSFSGRQNVSFHLWREENNQVLHVPFTENPLSFPTTYPTPVEIQNTFPVKYGHTKSKKSCGISEYHGAIFFSFSFLSAHEFDLSSLCVYVSIQDWRIYAHLQPQKVVETAQKSTRILSSQAVVERAC